jgi:WD40 repeat protein
VVCFVGMCYISVLFVMCSECEAHGWVVVVASTMHMQLLYACLSFPQASGSLPHCSVSARVVLSHSFPPPHFFSLSLRALVPVCAQVFSVAFSPDGKSALSGSNDKTVILWDLEKGEVAKRLEGHTGWVTCALLGR